MTETGHGSNVQALGTTATYDPEAGEFVVHTPTADARKDYIGNAARDGRMAAVFAQLIVGGEERGVHALLVPIRDDAGERAARRHDRGLRREARARRRRQRTHRVRRTCASRATRCSTATRDVRADGTYYEPDREPGQALLRDARAR